MERNLLILLILVLAACSIKEESPVPDQFCEELNTPPNTHQAAEKIDDAIDASISDGLTGVVVTVVSGPKGHYTKAAGLANLQNGLSMKTCHKFRVASLTKVFTATLTMMLVAEGALDLDAIVGDLLDPSQVSGIEGIDQITVEELLNHTSGIPNYDDDPRFAPMILNNPGRHITLEQKLNLVRERGGRAPRWVIKKLGQIYSNTNYLLLQLVIEKVTGKTYEKVLVERIIAPYNLSNTSLGSTVPYPSGLVTGYVDYYGNGIMRDVHEWDAHRFDAEGDLISTVEDISTFFQLLLAGEVIAQPWLEMMKDHRLGLLQETFEFENALGHDGIAIGYSAEMWYLPESELMIVMLSNQGRLVNENESVLKFENLLRQIIELAR